jgi:hypothetical protein
MVSTPKTPVRKKVAVKTVPPVQIVQQDSRIDWRSLYLYAVCLITLMVCLFSLVSAIRNGINAIYPDPAYVDPYATTPKIDPVKVAEQIKNQNQRQGIKSLIDSMTTLIIAGPLYLYHWRLVRK